MVNNGHQIDPSILREYDIRGIVGETLSEADAHALGRAFSKWLADRGAADVCVGRDGRVSSEALEAALVDGLVAGGMAVTRVGLGPTPMLYYATVTSGAGAGIMVTGSHNPPHHNGFKIMAQGKAFYGDDILTLGEMAAAGAYGEGTGSQKTADVLDEYVARLAGDYSGTAELAVAWDAGNGSAGQAMERLAARLPGRAVLLNAEIDGTLPNHP
ncbi:MAG: phosphomannomutase, partial [Alphaproteobacteria bacterium]|nr:phosphomannomutase [Alphaproteobacteria bacterium]